MSKKIVSIISCALIISAFACTNVFAGGWESGDWTGVGGPGSSTHPGSGGAGCGNNGLPYAACNGYSWIFYEYIGRR